MTGRMDSQVLQQRDVDQGVHCDLLPIAFFILQSVFTGPHNYHIECRVELTASSLSFRSRSKSSLYSTSSVRNFFTRSYAFSCFSGMSSFFDNDE